MGSVTNPTGTVSGHSLTGLTDAADYAFSGFTTPQGSVPAQWQFVCLASDHANVCQDANGTFRGGEITLRFLFIGYADLPNNAPVYPPSADLPVTFSANGTVTTSDNVHRTCKPYVMQAKSNGNAGTDTAATSGSITVSQFDSSGVSLSWDLYFGTSHTTGSLTSSWCGTPP